MPVQLAQTPGLQGDKGRGNGLGDGEVRGINLVKRPAISRNGLGRMLKSAVNIG